jgi:hypothetical protein
MTAAEFTRLLVGDAKPVAVTCLYRTATGYLVISEAAGLYRASPASLDGDMWGTVGGAYEHSAKVIAEHVDRTMPATTPPLPLPDFSPDIGEPT